MNLEIAQVALAQYDLPAVSLTFLGQSQNTSFRIETAPGEVFLLRLHVGLAADQTPEDWRSPEAIQSELLWLDAIAQETDLSVPQPLLNRLGNWVTMVDLDGGPIACSLLRWVEGEHLAATGPQIVRLGRLMAQLHQQASNWSVPPGFSRPNHDAAQLRSAIGQLGTLVQNGTISAQDYQVFRQATAQVETLISTLEKTPDTWGLIHADLHQGNYLVHNTEVRPIDFSRCGFGFYLYDIGESLGDIEAALRPQFFEGYASLRPLPAGYQSVVEAFFIGATVENFAFHSSNP
ncbi:MAG: phosphotransferase enzyme family protein [Elainella sp.]